MAEHKGQESASASLTSQYPRIVWEGSTDSEMLDAVLTARDASLTRRRPQRLVRGAGIRELAKRSIAIYAYRIYGVTVLRCRLRYCD